jgi:hypothetical protein
MRGARGLTLVLVIGAAAAMPLFVGGTYYTYLGIIVFIYGIVAIGLNILSGYAGQFSLGHAAFMAMGAYTTALLTKPLAGFPFFAHTGLHIWLGIVCGTILAALSGIVLTIPALRVRGARIWQWSRWRSAGSSGRSFRNGFPSPAAISEYRRSRNRRSACCGWRRRNSITWCSRCSWRHWRCSIG